MNPMSLLTKGRTIGGMKERPGRYKLLANSAFPNFSGPKNPFPTTPHPEPEKTQTALFEQAKPAPQPAKEEVRPAVTKASSLVEKSPFARASALGRSFADKATDKTADKAMAKAEVKVKKKEEPEPKKPVRVVPKQDQPAKPPLWSHLATIPTGWMDKWMPRRKTPPFPSATVQTELALEKVKVIRNDLSEDDLEVVMIDSKVGNKAGKPVQVERVDLERIAASP
jgi:hypothetical protein